MAFKLPFKGVVHGQKRKRGTNNKQNLVRNAFQEAQNQIQTQSLQKKEQQNVYEKSKPLPLSEKRRQLLRSRAELPIWPHASTIGYSLSGDRHVLILVGETGSGKSTQVPQFLMSEPWCKSAIAVTEPRRVAATSLARRVADEVGTPLGTASPASKVGYSVRFDPNFSPSTKIKYLTEGMLLQELLRDPWLTKYSVVVIDEVHERGVNVDLIMGFVRRILGAQVKEKGRQETWRKGAGPLKVAVMSATADTEKLVRYFEDAFHTPLREAPNETVNTNSEKFETGEKSHPNETPWQTNGIMKDHQSESESSWSGISSSEESSDEKKTPESMKKGDGHQISDSSRQARHQSIEGDISEHISTLYIEGRQHPVETFYAPSPTQDFVEATLKTIFQVHLKEPLPGDILVFLTGQDVVESLESLVNENAADMGPEIPKILALPLFAALPHIAQQRVFHPTPPRTRKVILATNIAETSVTIPGIRFVIDCGLAKIKEYRSQLGLESLLVKPISKSAAIQRKGRAGREAPGKCYRLYTESDYLTLDTANTPEILRCDLAMSLLVMKARGIPEVIEFPYLDPPRRTALRQALAQLHRLSALDSTDGAITPIGRQMARLPLPPPLSRALIAAADPAHDCILAAIDIIASLTAENIFLPLTTPHEDSTGTPHIANDEAADADADADATAANRRALSHRTGDHLTYLATVRAYAAEESDRRAWCARHRVSHRAMKGIMDVRKQLREQCRMQGLLGRAAAAAAADHRDDRDGDGGRGRERDRDGDKDEVIRALKPFLTSHTPNIALLHPDGSYKTLVGNQTVAIHPSSVLFGRGRGEGGGGGGGGRKYEVIMYSELVYTTRCFARRVSGVEWEWVREVVGGLESANGSMPVER